MALDKIRIDGGTQPRAEIDEFLVAEYSEAMRDGAEFPPVIVFQDGVDYWLADGFHRYHAALRNSQKTLVTEIKKGTKRDAVLYSVGANSAHGQRRTNADKRRAVLTLLNDEEWGKWSNAEIARRCAVGDTLVGELKRSLSPKESDATKDTRTTYRTKHGTVTTMNVERIGRRNELQPLINPVSEARLFGEMALSQLSRIRRDDPDRLVILREVITWCQSELKERGT